MPDDRAVEATIEQNDYQYFMYEVSCDDCTVMIGVQTLTGGNPDLYINFGDDNLPDKDNFDFESTSFGSEVFTLNI